MSLDTNTKIAVIGLGYVGLPLALALTENFKHVAGFDIDSNLIEDLKAGRDLSGLGLEEDLKNSSLQISADPKILSESNFFIVSVPTPVDINNKPDLRALESATKTVAKYLKKGTTVVYESTVYPGLTEEICVPLLEEHSKLKLNKDFGVGYSPERINPGDKEHSLENVVKIISGSDETTIKRLEQVYGSVVKAGLHVATSIKVAEAAKVIENTQRDLNIALMNELALIFDRLGISTNEVIEAAGTKWNFLKFKPGLVGGHCIGVDPYYLTTKAEQVSYLPRVILAGRGVNNEMGYYVARRTIKLMVNAGVLIKGACVGVYGVSFKENVPDVRNSRVPDIIRELREFGVRPIVVDPVVSKSLAIRSNSSDELEGLEGVELVDLGKLNNLDALIIAVSHKEILEEGIQGISSRLKPGAVLVDVKSSFNKAELREDLTYWSL